MRWLLGILALSLTACAAPQTKYPRHPLVAQILSVRPGVVGLSNRACVEWGEKNECTRFELAVYDLEDADFREAMTDFGFVCNVGGRRFKVCQDKAGFCRTTYVKGGFLGLGRKKIEDAYISQADNAYLANAKTRCASKNLYPMINAWGAVPFGGLSQ